MVTLLSYQKFYLCGGKLMIDKPTRIGNLELYNARVLNVGVAKYYGVLKEYNQILELE